MIKIVFFKNATDAEGITVLANAGQSIMRAAIDADLEGIAADCGGALSCATCHVLVREPWLARLPVPSTEENDMLGFTACERQANSRLSCQIKLTVNMDGIQIDLPASQY